MTDTLTWRDRLEVDVPEGELNGVRISRFTVERDSIENIRLAFSPGGPRDCRPGTYTRIDRNGTLWMSDTDAERRDHWAPLHEISKPHVRRVLVNGLGLGMIVHGALTYEHVEHIDVVEINADIIALVGPHYEKSGRVTIHHADAFDMEWPKGTTWDVGWSDIWPTLCVDDLDEHARMNRKYGRRCTWHQCWGNALLKSERRREQRSGWGW